MKPNIITFNTMMDCAIKKGDLGEAFRFFEQMLKDDLEADNITYSIILNGLKLNNTKQETV